MIYLDEVAIHNFKSFKNATIQFNKGFNCIVGPNGSGKSNICDSLLFALGESSLKRMRVHSALQLINSATKANKDDGFKKAYVKVRFAGEREIEVTRALRSDKKIGYRLDGKRVTRQEVLEVLRAYHAEINETNTMTQGEITYLLNLNPKERRGLIDTAAGISEFNEKRDTSIKELEKVDSKINESKGILHERSGFLGELEKEKKDAERYLELQTAVKQTSYTLLKLREKEIMAKLEEVSSEFSEKSKQKQAVEKKISETDTTLSSLNAEKDRLSKSISARSAELGAKNRILEEVNKNIAVGNTQLAALNENIKSLKAHLDTLESELKKAKAKEKENNEQLKKLKFELEVKAKDLPETEEESSNEGQGLSSKYEENYRKIEKFESEFIELSADLSQHITEQDSTRKITADQQKQLADLATKRTVLLEKIKLSQESLSSHQHSKNELQTALVKETKALEEIKTQIDALYVEHVNQRELLAQLGREGDRSADAIKKHIKGGFHGRAQELCNYDDKYALAVQAAAGNRLNYLVVDSISIADDAIKVLKSQKLGRASFIPLEEINVKAGKSPKNLNPLIDHIKFDGKYAKAFEYIFSNTYIVDSIKDAQKLGLGTYRFVTLEGDIAEPSGIVTGGTIRASASPAVVEARIKTIEAQRQELLKKQSELNTTLDTLRKRIVGHEADIMSNETVVKDMLNNENEINREAEVLNTKIKANETKHADLHTKIEKLKAQKKEAEEELTKIKGENTKIRETLDKIVAGRGKGKSKEEAAKLKSLRDAVERLKIDIASFTKENDLLKVRMEELKTESKVDTETVSNSKNKISQIEADIENLTKQKAELEETMQSHDKKTSSVMKEIQQLDEKLSKLGFEKGTAQAERERLNRDSMESEGKKTQFQTRLNDIKAELMQYPKMETLQGKAKIEDLEKELIIAKNEIERLGAVNMKAPEMFEAKSKDVAEAQQKLDTLESEKAAIMSMIEEIETKKMNVFMDTLNTVNDNFKKLYSYIFDGETYLYLQNPKDPFNSGLMVDVTLGKKKHNSDLLSGGQKSLIMLMLIFAIQMRKPMSFYFFDEIDIALDKENSKKLSTLIKELSAKSQFIVVSHNDSLIAAADTALGVVNKAGESQVVGVQLTNKQ